MWHAEEMVEGGTVSLIFTQCGKMKKTRGVHTASSVTFTHCSMLKRQGWGGVQGFIKRVHAVSLTFTQCGMLKNTRGWGGGGEGCTQFINIYTMWHAEKTGVHIASSLTMTRQGRGCT